MPVGDRPADLFDQVFAQIARFGIGQQFGDVDAEGLGQFLQYIKADVASSLFQFR